MISEPSTRESSAARARTPRRLVALVVMLDLVVASVIGFAVYFSTRKFGPPTAPRMVDVTAEVCSPREGCDEIRSSVTLRWEAPRYGGDVVEYVVYRDDAELERLDAAMIEYVDESAFIGAELVYTIQAVGEEGTSPRSTPATIEVPLPPLEDAVLSGQYRVRVVFRRVQNLSGYYGIEDPSAGDSTTITWNLDARCRGTEGACPSELFGGGLLRPRGGSYRGRVSDEARCLDRVVRSIDTISLRVTSAEPHPNAYLVSTFTGTIVTDFRCGQVNVHGVSALTGTRLSS